MGSDLSKSELTLEEANRHPQQRVSTVRVEGDVATLTGPSLEIRFPARWGRKLMPWYGGPGRTILCNADPNRFNLVGATKVADHLILSYVETTGELAAERVAGHLVETVDGLLSPKGPRPDESG